MLKSSFAEFAESISIKIGIAFSHIPLSPNAWTVISVVPAIFGFAMLVQREILGAIALFALSAIMDAIDGGVARVTGRVTNLGAYLDGIADRLVEALLLFGLLFYGVQDWLLPGYAWIALVLFFGTMMTSYTRAYADHRKALVEEEVKRMPGILERAERLVLIFAGMVASVMYGPIYITYALVLVALLAIITVAQRIFFVVRASAS
ncbi:MAG: CDP-alcohol phosphatidyltransferase family protein [Candidatus Burarchaeum sp.]|nr:CDP-alcohol phosphatidyltransferase family protein [Candidatus Burarchaeum sp.]MDO8340266.1 CDP-alcohol phosphatidyltransferase family protein [Candidatus Burarchaeum sp.]